ncbi:hypothetical protein AC481_03885, partial [miscellaneous Crenarchaeota group archaeon SMTZ-80]
YHINKVDIFKKEISQTFHGRDIFAHTAALIAERHKLYSLGDKIDDYLIIEFEKAEFRENEVTCKIIHIDNYGNLITNIHSTDLNDLKLNFGSIILLQFRDKNYNIKFHRTYSDVSSQELMALIGSHNFLEIAENLGNAGNRIASKQGDKLKLTFLD